MLDFVDKTFHQVPLAVQPLIVLMRVFGIPFGRNNRFCTAFNDQVNEILRGITSVSNDMVKAQALYQSGGLRDVMSFTGRQAQPQRVAQTVHRDMNLGAEPTPAAAQGLLGLPTVFFEHRPHRDAHEQSCYRSAHFPYPDHLQNRETCVPKHLAGTTGQTVCRCCSNGRIQQATTAIGHHCDRSTARLQQNDDRRLRPYQHKYAGLFSGNPEFLPIDRLGVSHLS